MYDLLALPFVIVPDCKYGVPYCQLADLLNLANNLITFAVYLAILVATIAFTYAGILYVTAAANQQNMEKAKKIFWNVLWGLIIVLAAWLVINIILSVITGNGLTFWTQKASDYQEYSRVTDPITRQSTVVVATTRADGTMSDTNARAYAASLGLTVADDVSTMDGTSKTTLDNAYELKKACKCEVVITSTTGGTHAAGSCTHGSGCKFDARTRDEGAALKTWVQEKLTETTSRSDGTKVYLDKCGNQYAIEGDHLDVTARIACPGII